MKSQSPSAGEWPVYTLCRPSQNLDELALTTLNGPSHRDLKRVVALQQQSLGTSPRRHALLRFIVWCSLQQHHPLPVEESYGLLESKHADLRYEEGREFLQSRNCANRLRINSF